MSICTCPFTGAAGTTLIGATTDTFGGTGTKTFTGTAASWQIAPSGTGAYNNSAGKCVVDAGVADVFVFFTQKTGGDLILMFRSNSGRTAYLLLYIRSTDLRFFDEAFNQIGSTFTGTISNNDVLRVEANGTSLVAKQNGTARITTTSSTYQTQTYMGFQGTGVEIIDDFEVDAYAVTNPTAAVTSVTPAQVVLAGTSGTGGTSPQWSRATAANGSYSNLSNGSGISGATSNTLTDASSTYTGLAVGSYLYYKVTYTTSGASNVQGVARGLTAANICVIGDSVAIGNGARSPYTAFAQYVKTIYSPRECVVYNAAVGGLSTAAWYDSAGSGVQSRLTTDAAAGVSAGATIFVISGLGINDASASGRTAAEYKANLAGIAAYALANGYSKVIIDYPTAIIFDGGNPTVLPLIQSYLAKIDELDNGTTIRVGDKKSFALMLVRRDTLLQSDGVHPNDTGADDLGVSHAQGFVLAIGDLFTTSGTTGGGGNLCGNGTLVAA